jgi:hypothetical protein
VRGGERLSYRLEPHKPGDKVLRIRGGKADLLVDFDDVNEEATLSEAVRIVALLNQEARAKVRVACRTCSGTGVDDDGERVRECEKTMVIDGCPLCFREWVSR